MSGFTQGSGEMGPGASNKSASQAGACSYLPLCLSVSVCVCLCISVSLSPGDSRPSSSPAHPPTAQTP